MAKRKSKINASDARRQALNAFDLAEEENGDSSAQKRMANAVIEDQNKSDDDEPDYLSGKVNPEDDEEIDSDAAFGSDDDFDYEAFMGGRMTGSGKKKHAMNLDENDENEDDSDASIDESQLIPLSEAWDIEDDESDSDGTEDSGSENDDEDEDSSVFSDLDDASDVDENQLAALRDQISGFSKSSEKKSAKKRLEVNNQEENEYSIPTSQKLSLNDLLMTSTGATKKSIKLLDNLTKKSKVDETGREKPAQSLNIPLPRNIQQRYDRQAAFEVAKDELDKWQDTVQKNRQAEHLMFPINPEEPVTKQSAMAPIKAATDLEKKVASLLQESSLKSEKEASNFEQLAPSKLTMEEVKKRRNELRLMRELMFREERKAKRIKKIKSKSYRKVHKKERERLKMLVEGDEAEEDEDGHDASRALERMNLKHKNTGKWAKRMVQQGFTKDAETRGEMEEMLRRGESLRRKIVGDDDSENSNSGSEDEQIYSDAEEAETVKNKLQKGLLGMNFMKEAQEKKRQENENALKSLQEAEELGDLELLSEEHSGANKTIVEGRMKFGPGTEKSKREINKVMANVREEMEEESTMISRLDSKHGKKDRENQNNRGRADKKRGKASEELSQQEGSDSQQNGSDSQQNESEIEENPWLPSSNDQKKSLKSKKTHVIAHANNTMAEKQILKAQKQRQKTRNKDSPVELIDMNQTLNIIDVHGSDAENDEDDHVPSSFKQKELIKRAFAGDDVVQEFVEEKRQKIEEEGDKEEDVTLPGWGSWGGQGLTPKRRFIKKTKGIQEKDRKDAKLKSVIINEKVNKKNARYNASNVPFPYENKEQYERSLKIPIGQEWSSKVTFQKLTKPRVIVKPGIVIDPLKAPMDD